MILQRAFKLNIGYNSDMEAQLKHKNRGLEDNIE